MGRFAPLLATIVAVVGLAGCGPSEPRSVSLDIPYRADGILEFLRPDSTLITRITIEIADTDSAQIRGLMDRRSLPERGGMLFYYEIDEPRAFWMRSTPLPLDLLFIGSDDTVLNVAKRTVPYSDTQIESDGPARHVLEVRAGFTDRWDIGPGTRIRWRRVSEAERNAAS